MSVATATRPLPYADRVLPLPRTCTFDPDDWQVIARYWYPVATSAEVSGQPLGVTLLDQSLVVYRSGGEIVVADNLCPHRGLLLSLGKATDDGLGIRCAYHGLRFEAQGRCSAIPAHPGNKIPERMHLRSYGVIERYGLVWTCLASLPSDLPQDASIPPVPHWDDTGFQQINCPPIDIAAFAGRQVEGFLDVAHFAFAHEASFSDPGNPTVPDYRPEPTTDGFEARYLSTMGNYPHSTGLKADPDYLWLRHFRLHVPFAASLVVYFPDGGHLSILNAASPVSARRTRLFDARVRDFDTDQPLQDVYDFNLQIFEEDRAMVEAQKPESLPLDPKLEVNIPADRSSVAYRRALRSLGLSRFFTA
ncbi:aromatic ring-hydroxylating dioxygenase subunit alpha [Kineosporia mesophila]|uniref:Aromatic ring-hydroxylating dioxygenase subunit alpha n=1 Tax=Kineosporia mesophila TaxID=566012 RepID=A0ABP7AL98_9ACTN|nr:aromatic ring-hydroxylating dioxygenase subunit alpha [Kineosporia mesophila]MCD5353970.1 aromatic ring-hydroxylating dioxygenase subunit alpha [Kineosporia mesophila]